MERIEGALPQYFDKIVNGAAPILNERFGLAWRASSEFKKKAGAGKQLNS